MCRCGGVCVVWRQGKVQWLTPSPVKSIGLAPHHHRHPAPPPSRRYSTTTLVGQLTKTIGPARLPLLHPARRRRLPGELPLAIAFLIISRLITRSHVALHAAAGNAPGQTRHAFCGVRASISRTFTLHSCTRYLGALHPCAAVSGPFEVSGTVLQVISLRYL
jgi:hypothetical protein